MTETPRGPRVFLVGAGPGDPGLITRRGLELVRSCDVLLFDRLVARQLVAEAPPEAERLFVGKTPGQTSMPQATIDSLIVERARHGKRVVRLKGGDPFVFGRGADEAQALAAAGISFEIVPGVSAAVAVPAYSGIPVTHGGVSSSFAVLTGHESSARPGAEERFAAIANGADTIVLLMSMSALEETTRRLVEAGRAPEEPVALIERGTTPWQRTIVTSLEKAVTAAREAAMQAPVTVVVGQVVGLRDALNWFESRPLFGRRVVVTRATSQAAPMVAALEELGAEVIPLPTIDFVEPDASQDLHRAVHDLASGEFEWVVFSSANAVDRLFGLIERRHDARCFARTKVAAVGPATAHSLGERGIKPDLVPKEHTALATAAALGAGSGRVLLPRPVDAPPELPAILTARGWDVTEVAIYRTVLGRPEPEALDAVRAGAFDVVVFTSPSTVQNFVELVGQPLPRPLTHHRALVACIGPPTSTAAEQAGFRVDITPRQHTTAALVQAIGDHVGLTLDR